MGRRALRKINPSLDLSWHFLDEAHLPPVCTAETLFGNPNPMNLEVGSGKGLFLANAARTAPDENFVGIEIARKYSRFAAARLAKAGLQNARVVHGDALAIVRDRVPDLSLAAVHVYFPDPWWKKRHHKRRVVTDSFLADIERVLVPGGLLHFWTDVEDYYQSTIELLNQVTQLDGPAPEVEQPAQHDLDYRTHFERRMRLQGQPVYRCRFTKR